MSTLWTAASVSATNGSNLITVQSGEDIAAIRANSWIMVGSAHIMEIKRTFVTDSGVKTIELFDDWEFGPATGQRATVAPSLGEFKTLADDVRRLIQIGEQQVNTASVTPEPGSSVKRSENGTVKTAEPQDDADAVRLQDFAPVKQKGESNEQAISSNSLAILRQRAMAKLERNAVFLGKFTEDRVVKSAGLSKIATSVAEGITYTSPDGITGIAANGTIATAGVNEPPIVYDPETGECLGLQTAPNTTNLWEYSEDLTQPAWSKLGVASAAFSSLDSPIVKNGTPVKFGRLEAASSGTGALAVRQAIIFSDRSSFQVVFKPDQATSLFFRLSAAKDSRVGINPLSGEIQSNNFIGDVDIKPLRGGAFLITVTDSGLGNSNYNAEVWLSKSGSISTAGESWSVGEGAYLTGLQAEQGYPSPYQPTGGSQLSRGATYGHFSNIELPSRFSIYLEAVLTTEQETSTPYIFGISTNDDTTNYVGVLRRTSNRLDARSNGITSSPSFAFTEGDPSRICIAYEGGVLSFYVNGELVDSFSVEIDTSDMTQVTLGGLANSLGFVSKTKIYEAIISGMRPTQAEAIALTTLEQ